MARLTLPVGQTDFRDIRTGGCYYIDKTMHISQIVRDGAVALQFTRPRRFGKTTFQSMLRAFFDIREDNRDIFTGLAIMDDEETVEKWMNKWPVIHLTFKDIDGLDFEEAYYKLSSTVSNLFESYRSIIDEESGYGSSVFCKILDRKARPAELAFSLHFLASLLYKHYGKDVIILLDECDVPLANAQENGYYPQMFDVIHHMLGLVLKDCPYTHKGILTGCLGLSEYEFTGLNNLVIHSVTSGRYSSIFGFTEEEVARLLHDAEFDDKADGMRQWYLGYSIGGVKLYTPWDVVCHVSNLQSKRDAKPRNYWTDTSGNDAVRRLLDLNDHTVEYEFSKLINGGVISKRIVKMLTFGNLYSSAENIWKLLFMTGYLTLAGKWQPNGETELRLPNEEVRSLFASCVDEWFRDRVRTSDRKALFEALWAGDAKALSDIILQRLRETISYYDYKEDYYHAFLAGLLSGTPYTVKSNRETGSGRADILVIDKASNTLVILEVKRAHSRDEMEKLATQALEQLKDREYGSDLEDYSKVVGYGVAFFHKEALVKVLEG